MPPPNRDSVSSAGITIDAATGEHYVPSSLRADGSKRREIRVRPGYKPPEDVALYKTRAAEAWKNRGKAGVPGAEGLNNEEGSGTGSGNNKNAKRREARRKAKSVVADQEEQEQEQEQGQNSSSSVNGSTTTTNDKADVAAIDNWRSFAADGDRKTKQQKQQKQQQPQAEQPVDQEAENDKKARNLKKKLRQARELNDKKDQGESLLPEQLDKVIKIQELIRQLDSLGLDANGEDKAPAEGKEKD